MPSIWSVLIIPVPIDLHYLLFFSLCLLSVVQQRSVHQSAIGFSAALTSDFTVLLPASLFSFFPAPFSLASVAVFFFFFGLSFICLFLACLFFACTVGPEYPLYSHLHL